MTTWAPRFRQKKARKSNHRAVVLFRPLLESLEDRVVPTHHGGAILSNVQEQTLFLGSGWSGATIPASRFETFLSKTIDTKTNATPNLSMLGDAGFPVVTGSGRALPGVDVANPTAGNGYAETGRIVSIRSEGSDDSGQPMVDVVFSDGYAYEHQAFLPSNPTESGNVKQAAAVQAVSDVLPNSNLVENVEPNFTPPRNGSGVNFGAVLGVLASNVSSIPVGVGQPVVNAAPSVFQGGTTVESRGVTAQSTLATSGFTPNVVALVSGQSNATGASNQQTAQTTPLFVTPAVFVSSFPAVSGGAAVLSPTNPGTTVVPVQPSSAQSNRVDGGGGADNLLPGDGQAPDGSTGVTPSGAPPSLTDVPVFGPLLMEAGRQLKAMRSIIPSRFWQAAPMDHATPPAPTGGLKGMPESKVPTPGRAKGFAISALLAVFASGFAGLIHEDRRHRRPRL